MRSALYTGQVYHKRLRPREHILRIRVFTFLFDIREMQLIADKMWLFSLNRFNLFSFYDGDVGETTSESLDVYINRKLAQAGIEKQPSRILLSCYPRVLGHSFNPISLFYCLDDNEKLFAVVHEVHNTFGERHAYALPVEGQSPGCETERGWIHQESSKELFVSPFNHMNMHYHFRLNNPDQKQVLVIKTHDERGHFLTASYTANREVLSPANLLRVFISMPLLSVRVIAGIHWHALRLWLKKVPWYPHQAKQSATDTITK